MIEWRPSMGLHFYLWMFNYVILNILIFCVMNIPIVYSTDKNGFEQLIVSIWSLLKTKNEETNYEIYVLTSDITDKQKMFLTKS